MAEELKACPFCGNEPRFLERNFGFYGQAVICDKCHIRIDGENCISQWNRRAQLSSQGGEAVEVVGYGCAGQIEVLKQVPLTGGMKVSGRLREKYSVPLMTVAQHQRILAAATHPADQVADDLTMVKVSRELLQDLRDLAFDQVEHHRAAMGAYKQTRQSAMDSVLAQADALLRS